MPNPNGQTGPGARDGGEREERKSKTPTVLRKFRPDEGACVSALKLLLEENNPDNNPRPNRPVKRAPEEE